MVLGSGIRERLVQIFGLVVLILAWTIVAMNSRGQVLPTPAEVVRPLWQLIVSGELWGPLLSTLWRTAAGFLLGFATGLTCGLLAWKYNLFAAASRGVLMAALFLPTLILLFVAFATIGITPITIVIVAGFVTFPEVTIYVRDVMQGMDRDLISMTDSYRVGVVDRVLKVYLPYLVPVILAVARGGFSHAWKVVLLCEVLAFPDGLGHEIQLAYRDYNLPLLLAWLSVFIGALLVYEQFLRLLERLVVRGR